MSRPYQIIPLVEQTLAWWEWRRIGIGSSDAAAVLGNKKAKTTEQLLREKQQPATDSPRTFLRERGRALERQAREAYCQIVGTSVAPTCVQSIARSWQRASLDGLSADGERVVEIKGGLATYQRVAARARPPSEHYAQLQHILAVTGLQVVDYWCYVPARRPLRLEIERDEPFLARLLEAEEVFWRRLAVAG